MPAEVAADVARRLELSCRAGEHRTIVYRIAVKDGVIQRDGVQVEESIRPFKDK